MRAMHGFLIDASVAESSGLLSDLPEHSAWALLDDSRDGMRQACEFLASFQGLRSVHLVCHGTPGALRLGATTLSENNLADYADELARIGASLADDGDLLIYGCRVAEGSAGRRFVDELAAHAGARVAASTTLVGDAGEGGDWALGYRCGEVRTRPISPAGFRGVLADEYGTTIATAGSIAVGGSVSGTLETAYPQDRDWFAIDLTANLGYTFTLDGTGPTPVADPRLLIYAPNGYNLASDDDSGVGSNALLVYTPEVSGTYYLDATGWSSTGGYTLGAAQTDLYAAGTGTTGSLAIGDSVSGALETAYDEDWFRITLAAGETYTFDLVASGATPMDDPHLRLRDAAGQAVDSDDNGGGGFSARITYTASSSGTYYLDADGWGNDVGGYTLTAAGPPDLMSPRLTGANPPYDATGASPTGNVVITFDEAIQRGSGFIYLKNASGAVVESFNAATSSRIRIDDATLTLDPTADLAWNTPYRVELWEGSLRDIAGNEISRVTDYGFSTAAQPSRPYAVAFDPADGTARASIGANIVVTFNESIQRGTGTVNLKTDAGALIESFDAATSNRITINGSTLALDPTASLAYNTGYVVEFAEGSVRNLSGTPWTGSGAYDFRTAFSSTDDYPGTIATYGSVPLGGSVQGTLETPNDADWLSVYLQAGMGYQFRLDGTGATPLNDPNLRLRDSVGYQITSDDSAGGNYNALVSFTPATSGLYYLQADGWGGTGQYTLSASLVDDYANDTSTSAAIGIGFTVEGRLEVAYDTDWFRISLEAGNSYSFSLNGATAAPLVDPRIVLHDATGVRLTSADNGGLVLNSLLEFTATSSGTYYLELAGWGDATGSYTLTTGGPVDINAPTMVGFSPADEATTFAPDGNIMFSFSEAITRGTGTISLIADSDTIVETFDAATSSRLSIENATLTLDPSAVLEWGTHYRVVFEPGTVGDLTGNAFFAGISNYDFATLPEPSAPSVVSFSPGDEAANATPSSNIVLTFSVPVQHGTGTIFLKNGAGAVIESFDAATSPRIGISGSTLTLDPTANLAYNTAYRVEFAADSVRDMSGNPWDGTTAYNFWTALSSADDYAGDATTKAVLAIGGSADGRIDSNGDFDWFAVNLVQGMVYSFTMDRATTDFLSDPHLKLYNAIGTEVANDDSSGFYLNAAMSYTASASGTYYLRAGGWSYTGNYTVSASLNDDVAGDASTTTSIALGATAAGRIDVPSDQDWYRITLTAGVHYTFALDGATVSPVDDVFLTIRNNTGTQVAYDDSSGPENNAFVSYTPNASGNYYVIADSWGDVGGYTLTATGPTDTTPPVVFAFTPDDESTGVSLGISPSVTFDEDVQRGAGTIYLKTGTGTIVESFDAATSARISIGGSMLIVDPTANLLSSTQYEVEFEAGAVRDVAGNPAAAIDGYDFWTADAWLAITPASASHLEGDSGTTAFTFTVTRTGETGGPSSAAWTVDGSQVTGADFAGNLLPSGTVSFAAGETSKTVTVMVSGDATVESDEAFSVTLSAPFAARLSTPSATGTILSDDIPILGTPGPDTLIDITGPSEIDGLGGNDTITGGSGDDTIDGGAGTDIAIWDQAATNFSLSFSGGHLIVQDTTGTDGTDTLSNIERLQFADKTVIVETRDHGTYADIPEALWHFFIVAFNAAPGVEYMDQLAEAHRYGLTVKQIVDIFTTKPQFTDVYPLSLSNHALAQELVAQIVKGSASDAAKLEAINDIEGALGIGWTRGDVIYTVFGNLGAKPFDDPTWGGTAKQFANEIVVAKYYTDVLNQSTTDLQTLRDVLYPVNENTDVSTPEVIATLVGVALMDG